MGPRGCSGHYTLPYHNTNTVYRLFNCLATLTHHIRMIISCHTNHHCAVCPMHGLTNKMIRIYKYVYIFLLITFHRVSEKLFGLRRYLCTNLSFQVSFKSQTDTDSLSGGYMDKRRLTYRLGFCVRGSLECCGSLQCTQEYGPSSSRESSSGAQEEA